MLGKSNVKTTGSNTKLSFMPCSNVRIKKILEFGEILEEYHNVWPFEPSGSIKLDIETKLRLQQNLSLGVVQAMN